jgi:hypothetical protein
MSSLDSFLQNRSRTLNLFERVESVVRVYVHGSRSVHDHMNLESFLNRVQGGEPNAVILRQSADPKTLDTRGP